MRQSFNSFICTIAILSSVAVVCPGCTGGGSDPVGPEKNSVQEYLDANPDQMVDEEEVSEEEEFDASGVE